MMQSQFSNDSSTIPSETNTCTSRKLKHLHWVSQQQQKTGTNERYAALRLYYQFNRIVLVLYSTPTCNIESLSYVRTYVVKMNSLHIHCTYVRIRT